MKLLTQTRTDTYIKPWHILANPSRAELNQIRWLEHIWSLPAREQPTREWRRRYVVLENGLLDTDWPSQEARPGKPTFDQAAKAWLRSYRRWNGLKSDWGIEPTREQLERKSRILDPSPWDLARLTPLQKFKRETGLRLLEPRSGGLVVRGEHSMTMGQYERLAARGALPGYWRLNDSVRFVDHTLSSKLPDRLGVTLPQEMPCSHHRLQIVGEELCSFDERVSALLPRVHGPNNPSESYVHPVISGFYPETGQSWWECQVRACGQSGHGLYDLDTIVDSAGIAYAICGRNCGFMMRLPLPISGGAGQTYFVKTNGSDAAAGTATGTAWATIGKARVVAEGTDVVNLMDSEGTGIWDETFSAVTTPGTSWGFSQLYQNHLGGTVRIRRSGATNLCISIISGGGQRYVELSGIIIDGSSLTSTTAFATVRGTTAATDEFGPWRFTDCEFTSAPKNSLLVSYDTHHVEIVGGSSHDNGQAAPVDANQHHLYYMAGDDHLIDGVEATVSVGYGVHAYTGGNDTLDRFVTRASICADANSAGLIAWYGDNVLEYNNLVYNNGAAPTELDGVRHRHGDNGYCINNVVYNNTGWGLDLEANTTGWTVQNNIFIANSSGTINNSGGGTHTISDNLLSGTATDIWTSPTTGDFTLKAGSAAIDEGIDFTSVFNSGTWPQSPPLDYSGTTRTGTWDQGAYDATSVPGGGDGDFPVVAAVTGGVNNSNATSQTVNLPAGIESGNLLLAFLTMDGVGTVTFPAGWTSMFDVLTAHAGDNLRMVGYYRIADGTEGASISVTNSTSEQSSHRTLRITNWHGTTPPEDASVAGPVDTAEFTANPPSLSPSWGSEKTLWVVAAGLDNGTSGTTPPLVVSAYPANYSDNQAISSGNNQTGTTTAVATRELEDTTDNPGTFTFDEDEKWIAATVAVRPAAAAAPSTGGGLLQHFRNLGVY